MPYASDKQRRYMHARHPKIAARWDREIKAQRVRKGIKRDLALGLATGTIGGIAANQLPQNQTPTKAVLKATGRTARHRRERLGKSVGYLYLDPKPTRVAGDGGTRVANPIKPLDALAAAELVSLSPVGEGSRLRFRRGGSQDNKLRRSYGQQLQMSLGVGRAQR